MERLATDPASQKESSQRPHLAPCRSQTPAQQSRPSFLPPNHPQSPSIPNRRRRSSHNGQAPPPIAASDAKQAALVPPSTNTTPKVAKKPKPKSRCGCGGLHFETGGVVCGEKHGPRVAATAGAALTRSLPRSHCLPIRCFGLVQAKVVWAAGGVVGGGCEI